MQLERVPVVAVDLVVDFPLRSSAEWVGAWAFAAVDPEDDDAAPDDELRVLATLQEDARDNGVWSVRRDGRRKRPKDWSSGDTIPLDTLVWAGAQLSEKDGHLEREEGPFFYLIKPPPT